MKSEIASCRALVLVHSIMRAKVSGNKGNRGTGVLVIEMQTSLLHVSAGGP